MKRSFLISVLVGLAVVFSACSQAAPPAPAAPPAQKAAEAPKPAEQKPAAAAPAVTVQWKAISGFAANYNLRKIITEPFIDEVEKQSQGQLKMSLVGPEAWPVFEQAKALREGAFDIMISTPAYYEDAIPGASVLNVNAVTPKQRRELGQIAVFDELYQKVGNAKFLANFSFATPNHMYLRNKKIATLDDVKGLKFGSVGYYAPMIVALGMQPVTLAVPEIVPALEKGIVDGMMYPGTGVIDQKYHEQLKYIVYPGIGDAMFVAMVNLDSWNKLPKNLQTLLEGIAEKMEMEKMVEVNKLYLAEQKAMFDYGMEKITLSDADTTKFKNALYEEYFKEIVLKRDPVLGGKLKQVSDKLPK